VPHNGFFGYGVDDDDAIYLGGHFYLIAMVYIGMLKDFIGLV
jgi:hypothetical protein